MSETETAAKRRVDSAYDELTWQVWDFARQNAATLDSERACAYIKGSMAGFLTAAQNVVSDVEKQVREGRKRESQLRSELRLEQTLRLAVVEALIKLKREVAMTAADPDQSVKEPADEPADANQHDQDNQSRGRRRGEDGRDNRLSKGKLSRPEPVGCAPDCATADEADCAGEPDQPSAGKSDK